MNKIFNFLRLSIGWLFSVTFLLGSFISLTDNNNPKITITALLLGLITLPPLSKKVEDKFSDKLTQNNINYFWVLKSVVIFGLMLIFGGLLGTNETNQVVNTVSTSSNNSILWIFVAISCISVFFVIKLFKSLSASKKVNEFISKEYNDMKDKYKDVIDIDDALSKRSIEYQELDKNIENLKNDYNEKSIYYKKLQDAIRLMEDDIDVIEYGVYKPHFNFDMSEKYKMALQQNYDKQKAFAQRGLKTVDLMQNKMYKKEMKNHIKLVNRTFNAECDAIISKVNWKNANQLEERIKKVYETINNMGENSLWTVSLDEEELNLKIEELRLTYEYELKKQEEKEEQRRIQEQIREEQKAIKEFEAARLQAEKDEMTYQKALLQAQKDLEKANEAERSAFEEKIAQLQAQLKEAEEKKERAISQAQLTKCGYIYVISNIGSFGEDVYKIGMTRRLEPMDRVNELGDASVPFKFDVHALIFSENAPELETKLHQRFRNNAVNLVNNKKEFFKVSLDEIEKAVHENYAEIEFTKIAEARDYRETLALRQSMEQTNNQIEENKVQENKEEFPVSM